ncbi:MAG: diguanylate cyclase [Spirochaetales bacterium]|nr:diguanylate cyclase [Spirochaetales bacterium]
MKRTLAFAAASTLLWVAIMLALAFDHRARKERFLADELELYASRVETTVANLSIFSRYVLEASVDLPEVTSLVARALRSDEAGRAVVRAELRSVMAGVYERLVRFDFRQLHFHFPDSTSFLRMHSPLNFGDSLKGVRTTVDDANATLRPVVGFEEGRIFNGYRFVYPLFHEGSHVGSVEVSFSMASFLNVLGRLSECFNLFVIRREAVESTVFAELLSNYAASAISDDYLFDAAVPPPEALPDFGKGFKARIAGGLATRGDFALPWTIAGVEHVILFKAVENTRGEQVAYLVSVREEAGYERLRQDFFLLTVAATLGWFALAVVGWLFLRDRARMRELSRTDGLTRLANRASFIERASLEFDRSGRSALPFCVAMFDIDDFKAVNDSFGHNAGDRVLKAVAGLLGGGIRATDLVARWGGEEFIALFPGTRLAGAARAAEKLRAAVEAGDVCERRAVTLSVGVAERAEGEGFEALVARADAALYEAKGAGKNRVVAAPNADGP